MRDPQLDLVLRGGTVVTAEGQRRADVGIRDGRVAIIQDGDSGGDAHNRPEATLTGARDIDATGRLLLPGGVDPHVHLHTEGLDPGEPAWVDDYTSGSQAALAGGITSVGNMSYVLPWESIADRVRAEQAVVARQAIADVFFHTVIVSPSPAIVDEVGGAVRGGQPSMKIFMCMPTFEANVPQFTRVMKAAGEAGGITLVHCEDLATIECCTTMLTDRAHGDLGHFADSRPVEAETVATERAIAMCRATGAPTYIVHLSSARALAACAAARAEGLPVFVETRPLYLHMTAERYRGHEGALYVAQPPLRERADQEALWRGLADGSIDTIAQRPRTVDARAEARSQAGRGALPVRGRRARHHVAAALHGGRRDRPAVAGAVRRADVDQRRPAVRHVSAQGNDRGRVRRRHRHLGDARAAGGARQRPVFPRASQRLCGPRAPRLAPRHHPARRAGVRERQGAGAGGQRPSDRAGRHGAASNEGAASNDGAASNQDAASKKAAARRRRRSEFASPAGRDRPTEWPGWYTLARTGTVSPAFAMSASDDENEVSRTVPRRGLVRETPRVGMVIVVGSGTAPDGLRTPRIVPMEQLTLQIGRRANPTPTPSEGIPASLTIPDPTVSSLHARIQRASSGADLFIVQDLEQHERHLRRRQAVAGAGAAARRRRAVPGLAGAGVSHRHGGGDRGDAGRRGDSRSRRSRPARPIWPSPAAKLRRLARTGNPRSCWSVRPASARTCSRTRSTPTAAAPASWSPSTARRSRASWSRASCSATKKARIRPPRDARSASSSWPTRARCSSTRSATCRPSCSRSCCVSCRIAASRRWAPRASSRPTCASSPPPAASALEKGAKVQEAVLGRLGAQPIVLPPLRDRIEDIGRLVAHFLRNLRDGRAFEPEAFHALLPARVAAERARAVEGDRRGGGAEPGRGHHRARTPARRGDRDAAAGRRRRLRDDGRRSGAAAGRWRRRLPA